MSDLAPFVAAVLRDQSLSQLLEENKALRDQLEKHQTLEITGRNGTPVYYKSSMSKGEISGDGDAWNVPFPENGHIPLDEIRNLEIRVGGDVRATFYNGTVESNIDILVEDFDRDRPQDPQMAGIRFWFQNSDHGRDSGGGVRMVWAQYGPVRFQEYLEVHDLEGNEMYDALLDSCASTSAQYVVISSTEFSMRDIGGTMQIIEAQGIQTEEEEETMGE